MKTGASLTIHKSWGEFIYMVAMPLNFSTDSLYFAKIHYSRYKAIQSMWFIMLIQGEFHLHSHRSCWIIFVSRNPHTCNFSSRFSGNWFSLMLKYPLCPCCFHLELDYPASSCSLSYYICVSGRERREEKKELLRHSVWVCTLLCASLWVDMGLYHNK